MKSSKEVLSDLSKECYNQITHYKFNRGTLHVPEKYRKGRLDGLQYISELTLYYMQKEKALQKEFEDEVLKQIEKMHCLNNGAYKQGIYDALYEFESLVKKISAYEKY